VVACKPTQASIQLVDDPRPFAILDLFTGKNVGVEGYATAARGYQ
jgi:hypothetical protein